MTSRKGLEGHDRLLHVDDHPSGNAPNTVDFSKTKIVRERECIRTMCAVCIFGNIHPLPQQETVDPICAVCASEKKLVLVRSS